MTSNSFKERSLYNKKLYETFIDYYQFAFADCELDELYNRYYALQEYIEQREMCEVMCND